MNQWNGSKNLGLRVVFWMSHSVLSTVVNSPTRRWENSNEPFPECNRFLYRLFLAAHYPVSSNNNGDGGSLSPRKQLLEKLTKDLFLTFHCYCTRKDVSPTALDPSPAISTTSAIVSSSTSMPTLGFCIPFLSSPALVSHWFNICWIRYIALMSYLKARTWLKPSQITWPMLQSNTWSSVHRPGMDLWGNSLPIPNFASSQVISSFRFYSQVNQWLLIFFMEAGLSHRRFRAAYRKQHQISAMYLSSPKERCHRWGTLPVQCLLPRPYSNK